MGIGKERSGFASTATIAAGERGQLGLLGVALLMALLTLTLIHAYAVVKGVRRMEERAKTYLCLRHFVERTKRQLQVQRRFDWAITSLNTAMALMAASNPSALPGLKAKKKGMIHASQISYAAFLTKLVPGKWCSLSNKRLLLDTPWRARGGVLQRSLAGTSVRKERWSFFIIGKNFGLRGKLGGAKKGNMLWSIREVKGDLFWWRP